jgi:hypothetical protein
MITDQNPDISHRLKLQNFLKILHREPDPAEVLINKYAANTKYLPISYVEMSLDEIFFGLWETTDFRWQIVGNEIVGSITLRVYHPTEKIWITRIGAAATMIRQISGAGITEIEKKIHNACELDFPHLKSDCVTNAAKSLGKMFGRDLNRKFFDQYRPLLHQTAIAAGVTTVAVNDRETIDRHKDHARHLLETSRPDDNVLKGIELALRDAESVQEIEAVIREIKKYIPEVHEKSGATIMRRAAEIAK